MCRYCGKKLVQLLSLGSMPIPNYFPVARRAGREKKYPLVLCRCGSCGLIETRETVPPSGVFRTYHYQTGASGPLVSHMKHLARVCTRFLRKIPHPSVLDIGCNDGTLLEAFTSRGVRVLGVEPARNVAKHAREKGIDVITDFFTEKLAKSIRETRCQFDLITFTHTLANIPDLADFFRGVSFLLKPGGTIVLEVASAEEMIRNGQFDTIYHEHYWYFTYDALKHILGDHGFTVTAAERVPIQGGSLLLFAQKKRLGLHAKEPVKPLGPSDFRKFATNVMELKKRLRHTIRAYRGKTVVGFGIPAKGVTLLNFCGFGPRDIAFVVDAIKDKQGKVVPGVHIPVYPEEYLRGKPVDAVLLLAWNYKESILEKLKTLVSKRVPVIIPFPRLDVIR